MLTGRFRATGCLLSGKALTLRERVISYSIAIRLGRLERRGGAPVEVPLHLQQIADEVIE